MAELYLKIDTLSLQVTLAQKLKFDRAKNYNVRAKQGREYKTGLLYGSTKQNEISEQTAPFIGRPTVQL